MPDKDASTQTRPARRRGRKPDPNAREKVIDAAARAFLERGYSGASIDDIANVMGVTKGFVYHQYDSKADLYFAVQEASTRRIGDLVRVEFETALPPREKLWRMAYAHVRAILTDFAAAKVGVQGLDRSLMANAGERELDNHRRYIAMRRDYEAMFAAVIRDGVDQGAFRGGDAGLLVKSVFGALNWITVWFDPDRPTTTRKINRIARTLADFVVQGLGGTDTHSSMEETQS